MIAIQRSKQKGAPMPPFLGARLLGGKRNAFWIVTTLVVALDQATKFLCAGIGMDGAPARIVVVPSFLNLVGQRMNERGAFSIGPDGAGFYVWASIVGLALILWFLLTTPRDRLVPHIALGCVAGGDIGNLIDRITLGAVRDFIDLHWMYKAYWSTFNVADMGICVGVGFLVWEAFRPERKEDGDDVEPDAPPDPR